MDIKYNLGRLSIPKVLLEGTSDDLSNAFFSLKIVPIRVEYDPVYSIYEYTAYSPEFSSLKEGAVIPKYIIHVTKSIDSNIPTTFKLKKVEEIK